MLKFTVLFLVICFSCFSQQFMSEPLPKEISYFNGPSLEVERGVRGIDRNMVTLQKPTDCFVVGSAPRGRMIVFQYPEQKSIGANSKGPEPPEIFYLQDNIWNESKRILEKYYEPPPNLYVFYAASDIARYNKVKVPAWKLDGIILDTKMPKGYKLRYPLGLP